jgi:hypothetical protein
MRPNTLKIIYSGLIAGFVSEGILGAAFSSPPVQRLLYNPDIQSKLFIEVTPTRDLIPSIGGIIILSVAHSWLFTIFQKAIPGTTWVKRGLFWGFTVWLMYWVFQEWFIYHTLLREPLLLNMVELIILLAGSLVEGIIISRFLFDDTDGVVRNRFS